MHKKKDSKAEDPRHPKAISTRIPKELKGLEGSLKDPEGSTGL